MNAKTTSKKNQVVSKNIFEREELVKKAEEISKTLRASSWKDLETHDESGDSSPQCRRQLV